MYWEVLKFDCCNHTFDTKTKKTSEWPKVRSDNAREQGVSLTLYQRPSPGLKFSQVLPKRSGIISIAFEKHHELSGLIFGIRKLFPPAFWDSMHSCWHFILWFIFQRTKTSSVDLIINQQHSHAFFCLILNYV